MTRAGGPADPLARPTPGRSAPNGPPPRPRCRRWPGTRWPARIRDGVARQLRSSRRHRGRGRWRSPAAGGPTVLLATWRRVPPTKEETALMEDAANSLRLALEREEAGSGPPGGGGAAPVAGAAARLPVPAQPRAADPADGDQGLRLQPDAAGRDLGRRLPAALPGPDRGRVGAARSAGRRPARLLRDRVGHPAPAAGLVRHPAGPRGGDRLPAAGQRAVGRADLRRRPARGLGRPRPAGAGLREPAEQRVLPQPAGDPGAA